MVEERITDSTRIAQLFASEITGLSVGSLESVSVVDAQPDTSPTPDGPVAYRLAGEESTLAEVRLYPDAVEIELAEELTTNIDSLSERDILRVSEGLSAAETDGGPTRLLLTDGASVKSGVDVLRALLE